MVCHVIEEVPILIGWQKLTPQIKHAGKNSEEILMLQIWQVMKRGFSY